MNAVAKIKDEGAAEIELENPAAAPTDKSAPLTVAAETVAPAPARAKPKRGRRTLLMLAVPLALATGGSYVWLTSGRYQETENANLRQARVTVSAEAAGRIVEVDIADNAAVKAGDKLFVVDPEPYRIALAQADASLAAARLNVDQLRAAYGQAVAQERVAASEVTYLKSQYDRAADLTKKGINAQSALDEAQRDLQRAEEQHRASLQGIESARAALGGDPNIQTNEHPSVLAAQSARDKAAFDLAQTTVYAPSDGVISQASSFKIGQYVTVGTPLFSLVETSDTWVEANFKETQLTHMTPGQSAEVVLDTYPGVSFHATVESIGAGTGAEFSLLPAQNATGNWVKVTQRIPVRLRLDTKGVDVPVRTGMSATVEVDTKVSHSFAGLFGTANAAE
ncbi:HlyD family secretion protein [Mesorhizobium sp. YM1C-6-2]|uniref:HlyD family secretion protein n=1 Tax=Mesorhizobium sp. YM1C-6-2 TaxID=1827501 RepID=UPI000EF1B1DA|nr:HlyD family secretion protein [Mesorhizobium sp. YM1C-6-2]RLP22335.1 HlyD family secretion protein [Mesorhizobium sp. YM1C-6-2]